MYQRVCGHEQEFGMRVVPGFNPGAGSQDKSRELRFTDWRSFWNKKIIAAIREQMASETWASVDSWVWFSNGSLVYQDSRAIAIEAATAEYSAGSLDGILQEKAMDMILGRALKTVVEREKLKDLSLYRNNAGPRNEISRRAEVTYSNHHNYCALREKDVLILQALENFLPASLVLSGSGHVFFSEEKGRCVYGLSQRAVHTSAVRDSNLSYGHGGASGDRYFFANTKQETLMIPESPLSRIHVICRDAVRCEFQIWLVDAITHLIIRLAEEHDWRIPESLALYQPLASLREVNMSLEKGLDCKLLCFSAGSGTQEVDLIDYNRIFLSAAKQLNPLSDMEKKGLQEWERVLELLKAKAFDKLVGELDWATKWFLLRSKMKKRGFGLDSLPAWKINMNYHNISSSPDESWFARLDQDGYIKHLVSQEDILKAQTTPPETRAKVRSELIRLSHRYPPEVLLSKLSNINWHEAYVHIPQTDKSATRFLFGNPNDPLSADMRSISELKSILADLRRPS